MESMPGPATVLFGILDNNLFLALNIKETLLPPSRPLRKQLQATIAPRRAYHKTFPVQP